MPTIKKVPLLTMAPEDNSPFGQVEKQVTGIIRFGRLLPGQTDPDFVGFPTRVVKIRFDIDFFFSYYTTLSF